MSCQKGNCIGTRIGFDKKSGSGADIQDSAAREFGRLKNIEVQRVAIYNSVQVEALPRCAERRQIFPVEILAIIPFEQVLFMKAGVRENQTAAATADDRFPEFI